MKHYITIGFTLFSILLSAQSIQWLDLEQAEVEMKANPEKPLFIDFYTNWCSWCKTMDRTTFQEVEVVNYINENFIPIKFNAEKKENVKFFGKTYKYVKPQQGNRGVNSFALFSLRGNLSYPAYAIMDHKGGLERVLLGYMPKDVFLERLNADQSLHRN